MVWQLLLSCIVRDCSCLYASPFALAEVEVLERLHLVHIVHIEDSLLRELVHYINEGEREGV